MTETGERATQKIMDIRIGDCTAYPRHLVAGGGVRVT